MFLKYSFNVKTRKTTNTLNAFQIAILMTTSLICCISLLESGGLTSAATSPAAAAAAAASQLSRTNQLAKQQQQHSIIDPQQMKLIQSANVELNRRSLQRAQRETPLASPNSIETNGANKIDSSPLQLSSSSSLASNQQQQQQQQAPTCGYPGSPAHASVTFNTTHVVAGTAASYTCDNGFELLGPPRRICQANGSWSPIGIPFCVLNVGLGKAAMQSSTAGHGSAQKAVDGSTSPYFQASTCTMTDVEHNPWWYVNLLEPYLVQIVRIDFGQACCANRQKATIAVRVGNNRPDLGNNPLCNRYHGFIEEGKPLFLPCTRPAPGAFVSIHLEAPSGSSLSICETFIYTDHALSIEQCPSFRDQPLGSTATYNGKCYLFHNNQALNFDSSRKYCESRGGTLVDETSPALQGFLSWELYRRHRNDQLMGQYWLGAVRDQRQPQNWKWINGKDVQISFWNSLATQGNCSRFDGSKGWLWSDTDCSAQLNFICQYRPLSCGKPEKPTNSTLLTKNIDNGTVIEYQCSPGNLLMGPKSRVCLPTGFFSEFAPKCKYLDCQFPAQIQNGDYKLANSTTSYQSVVNYHCNEGYQLYGRAQLTCDVDERWNGPPPRCEPLLCPAPVAPSNGYVTVTSNITIPGTQATYDCRPGYELVGDRLLSCLSSGSWDNSFPYCREKRQTLLPHVLQLPNNAQQNANNVAANTQRLGQNNNNNNNNGLISATGGNGDAIALKPTRPLVQQPNTNNGIQLSSGLQSNSNNVAGTKPTNGQTTALSSGSGGSGTTPSSVQLQLQSNTTPAQILLSSASLPASLNGLAGQFVTPLSTAQPSGQQVSPTLNEIPTASNSIDLSRRPSFPLSSQVATSQQQQSVRQLQQQQQQQPSQNFNNAAAAAAASSSAPAITSSSGSGSSTVASISRQQQLQTTPTTSGRPFSPQQHQFGSTTQPVSNSGFYDSLATTNSISVHPNSNNNNNLPSLGSQAPTSGDNSAAAILSSTTSTTTTTSSSSSSPNSQSSSAGSGGAAANTHFQQGNVLASFGSSSLSPTSSIRNNNNGGLGPHFHHHHQQQHSPISSSPNALSSAKYSLDGIIAVAIFGGFIFLGAIITILVMIIRRKSSQSSSIDAQTISTYDSANGGDTHHNGLYRNYQHAWENLRFATPASQPKLSGGNGSLHTAAAAVAAAPNGSNGLITAHISGGPSIGLKNYASPSVMLHHHHHQQQQHPSMQQQQQQQQHCNGHVNLAMISGNSSSATTSSHSSNSSLGVGGVGGSGDRNGRVCGTGSGGELDVGPLLGSSSSSSSAAHLHSQQHIHHQHHRHLALNNQQQQNHRFNHDNNLIANQDDHDDILDDDDEDEDEEQGVISADEANYVPRHYNHHHHRHHHHNHEHDEGFRDTNELTINAVTASIPNHNNQAARRRSLFSAAAAIQSSNNINGCNSIGRNSMLVAAAAATPSSSSGANLNRRSLSNLNQQNQRLVITSSNSSNSTQSSRASPPSDDHSLDRLAYGNNWHNQRRN